LLFVTMVLLLRFPAFRPMTVAKRHVGDLARL
jgi:hypothetical protein